MRTTNTSKRTKHSARFWTGMPTTIAPKVFVRRAVALLLVFVLLPSGVAGALVPDPGPSSNSIGISGSFSGPAPTEAATIATPTNGQTFTNQLVTVAGLCPKDLLLKVYDNEVFVGSAICENGSYSLQISLFPGTNLLVVRVFDTAEQQGPDSNTVTVTYNAAEFGAFGSFMTLSSIYARKGENPGKKLSWPILLSGGTGPYAVSVDWGDGQAQSLISLDSPGEFTIEHVYTSAGIYKITVKATDVNGNIAYLQLVGIANGNAASTSATSSSSSGGGTGGTSGTATGGVPTSQVRFLTIVSFMLIVLLLPAFWLGRKYELLALHHKIERDAAEFARREAQR